MKQYFGMSQTGNLKEAAQGVHAPGLLILMSNADSLRHTLQNWNPFSRESRALAVSA